MADAAVAEIRADAGERRGIHAVLELVSGGGQTVTVGVGDEQVDLPRSLVEALLAAAGALDVGEPVAIIRQNAEVSPSQAAKLLGVSRQYVDRLVEADVLPSRRLPNSTYRRIPVRSIIEHRATRERKSAGITAIIDEAIAAGLPY